MAAPPIPSRWDGEAFVPLPRFMRLADRHFVIDEVYPMVVQQERSGASHRHYFAAVHEGWTNLPEHLTERFPTEEHLRRYALIRAGYRDERSIVCASKAEAARVAAFVRPADEYAVVLVSEAVVTVYTAKSQSMKAMGKQQFQESKDAVLGIIANMIGVQPAQLEHRSAA